MSLVTEALLKIFNFLSDTENETCYFFFIENFTFPCLSSERIRKRPFFTIKLFLYHGIILWSSDEITKLYVINVIHTIWYIIFDDYIDFGKWASSFSATRFQ